MFQEEGYKESLANNEIVLFRFVMQLLLVNLLSCCMLLPLVLLEVLVLSIPGQCILSESVSTWISSLSILCTLLIGSVSSSPYLDSACSARAFPPGYHPSPYSAPC
jgi:hypothetical protein